MDREDQIKTAKLERRLMVGELAAKQAAEANENIKAVEADFYLKKWVMIMLTHRNILVLHLTY